MFRSLQVVEHSLQKTTAWLHEKWGSYHEQCIVTTTTTVKTTKPATSTADVKTTIDNGSKITSSVNYMTAATILLGMHIFTLIIWVHLRI